MLDVDVALTMDGDELTDAERRNLLAATDGLALLRGKWVEVNRDQLQQALDHWKEIERAQAKGIDFIQEMRLLSGATLGGAEGDDAPAVAWSHFVAGDWLRGALEQLRSAAPDRACQPGRELQATLRPYQVDGVCWLWFLTQLGLVGCLADDMGLGKTIQMIDLLLQRRSAAAGKKQQPPCLLVVPASLLGNWRQELTRFAPTLKVQMLHRSECSAETLAQISAAPAKELAIYDLVVTTYGLVRRQPWLSEVQWSLIVLDEAQAIKNAGSSQARSVKELAARSRLILTGTPVENHLGDLWSLFDFACPGLLGSAAEFKRYVKRLNAVGGPQVVPAETQDLNKRYVVAVHLAFLQFSSALLSLALDARLAVQCRALLLERKSVFLQAPLCVEFGPQAHAHALGLGRDDAESCPPLRIDLWVLLAILIGRRRLEILHRRRRLLRHDLSCCALR